MTIRALLFGVESRVPRQSMRRSPRVIPFRSNTPRMIGQCLPGHEALATTLHSTLMFKYLQRATTHHQKDCSKYFSIL